MTEYNRHPKVPLHEQLDEAQRELTARHRRYPMRVKDGSMSQAEMVIGIDRQRAIRNTLRQILRFEEQVRSTLDRCIKAEKKAREGSLLEHPATMALTEAFPDAALDDVRDIEPPFFDESELMAPGSGGSGSEASSAVEGPAP